MNQKISKKIRKIVGFKVHRPRELFKHRETGSILADEKRAIYKLAKKVYKSTADLNHVSAVVVEAKERLKQ